MIEPPDSSDKSTFMRMREDEREIRKTLIINAAMNLIERMPFQNIGMRDIAAEAGVSAASIYRYFPSRDDLFAEALIRDFIILEQRFERRLDEENAELGDLVIDLVDHLLDNEGTYQMMSHFMIMGQMEPRVLERFNTVQRYFLDLMDQVLIKSTGASGRIRMFSHAFFASLAGVIMTFRNYPGRGKEERRKHMHRLTFLLVDVFKKGIGAAVNT
jgi:AcrR family transcriptional regulator